MNKNLMCINSSEELLVVHLGSFFEPFVLNSIDSISIKNHAWFSAPISLLKWKANSERKSTLGIKKNNCKFDWMVFLDISISRKFFVKFPFADWKMKWKIKQDLVKLFWEANNGVPVYFIGVTSGNVFKKYLTMISTSIKI